MTANLPVYKSLFAILFILFFSSCQQNQAKVAYVKSAEILGGYYKTKDVTAELQEKIKSSQNSLDSLKLQMDGYLRLGQKKQLDSISHIYDLRQNQYRQHFQEEDQKISEKLLGEINAFLQEYGQKHKYQIIFGASGSGNIVYADAHLDITKEVLEALNKTSGE